MAELASMIRAMVAAVGEEAVAEQLAVLPDELIDGLREAAENDPVLNEVLYDLLPKEERRPRYEAWFVASGPPAKPDKAIILDLAQADRMYYEPLREQRTRWLALYHMEKKGHFRNFDKDKDELYTDSSISDNCNAMIARGGAIDPSYDVPILKPDLRDEGQKAEDYLLWCDRMEASRHRARTGEVLRRAEWAYLVLTGMVCWRTTLDPEDTTYPFQDALLDPSTVFPKWDDHGLERVTRIFQENVGRVISMFDDGSGKVARKILSAQTVDEEDKAARFYKHGDWGQVVVYDDRWWHAVYFNDVEIVPPVAHRYGFVPYVIQGTGMGEPAAMLPPDLQDAPAGGATASDQTRLVYKHVSPIHFWDVPHNQVEAIAGKMKTIWANIDRPNWMLYQTEFSKGEGTPAIKVAGGNNVNPLIKDHDELMPLVERTDPTVFGPLMQLMMQNRGTNQLSPAGMGVNPGANASGNAIEGLADSGRDVHETPLLQAMESFHEAKGRMRLTIARDWGDLLRTGEDGDYGVLTIPYQGGRRRRDGLPPAFELTPEMLDRVGTDVEAHLTSVQLRNLGPLGNAVNLWVSGGMMSRREAIAMRGHPDPDDVIDELTYEETMQDPDILKAMRLKKLRERDPEAYLIARELMNEQRQNHGQGGTPGGPPQGQNFGNPGVNSSAMNLPALGMGQVGPTGRPPAMAGAGFPMGGQDVGP